MPNKSGDQAIRRFRDISAEQWLRQKSESLLAKLKGRWRGDVQDTIASGLERGINPNSVGLELAGRMNPETRKREGGAVKLDADDHLEIARYRRALTGMESTYFDYNLRDKRYDRSFRRSMAEQVPFATDKIDMLVTRFENKFLKHKADLIAQTEMLAAMNRSEFLSTREAIGKSDLPEAAVTRIWESCGDEKVRPSHRALEGQSVVGFIDSFVSPLSGAKMMHPGDRSLGAPEDEIIGCRCRIRYDIDFLHEYRE